MRIEVLLLSLTMLLAVYCFGQKTCELVGTVTDTSGAVVPGATVTITNTGTGATQTIKTAGLGEYTFPDLLPGTYTLRVALQGFKTQDVQPFKLDVGQAARQDVKLEVGATTQLIAVSSTNVLLETQNATQGQVIENKEIEDLPLNGRDFMQLASLSVGVVPQSGGTDTQIGTYSGYLPSVSIGGLREEDISYPYDGIETRNSWYGAIGILPSIDSIQEFKVLETGSSAEYGGGGGFIEVVTKSGTNTLHGTAYEFFRNNDLDARNFFDIGPAPPFRQNQFGGSVGGPILRNKLFFFANYEGLRQASPVDFYSLVPTQAEDQGNFSAFSTPLIYPYTGSPFLNNTIPSAMISPIATKILSWYPAPNGSFPGNLNYYSELTSPLDWDQVDGRLDYYVSDKDRLFLRYTWEDLALTDVGFVATADNSYPETPRNTAVGWTHTMSPTVVNQFHLGWNFSENGATRANGFNTSFANPFGLNYPLATAGNYGVPNLGLSGYADPGSFEGTTIEKEDLFVANDSLLIQKGKHSISVGAEIHYDPIYQDENWAEPEIEFNGEYTGQPVGDLLLGIPYYSETADGDPTLHWRRWYIGLYGQDNVRLTKNLTLNLGLRWDYLQPPVDTRNHVGSFDYATDEFLAYPATDVLGLGRNMVFPDYKDVSPRVGLAWVPHGKNTVIRAGFGKYFLQANINYYEQEVDIPQYYSDYDFENPPPGLPFTPTFLLSDLFNTAGLGAFGQYSFEDPHNKTPYSDEWNLSVEHTFGRNWMLELAYNGSEGTHIAYRPNLDTLNSEGLEKYPNYANLIEGENGGTSNYNAVEASIQKRSSSGLTLLGSYTYSRCLNTPWQNQLTAHPFDIALDYGNCVFNLTQRLVVSPVYELPAGKGKPYLNHGALSNILGGWELSGIAQFSTGPWATLDDDQFVGGFNTDLPNVIGPVNNSSLASRIRQDNLGPYFNVENVQGITACCGFQGDASFSSVKTPGVNDWDLSIFKQFPLFERSSLTFRTDFFNAFNHAQFNGVNTFVPASNFGYVTGANPGREIQFSLRLAF